MPMAAVANSTPAPAMAATSTSLPPVATADADDDVAKSRKRRTAIIASLVVVALLLIGGLVWALTRGAEQAETIAVPNVVGLTQAEAKTQIEQAGFTWELNPDKVASDTVAEGAVASTDPAEGRDRARHHLLRPRFRDPAGQPRRHEP